MAQQTINVGATENDGTGDKIRAAMIKIAAMFTELYTGNGGLVRKFTTAVLAADTVGTIALGTLVSSGTIVEVVCSGGGSGGGQYSGRYYVRGSSECTLLNGGANAASGALAVPTGTTGVAGKATVSINGTDLKIENRTAGNRFYTVYVLA